MKKLVIILMSILAIGVTGAYGTHLFNDDVTEPTVTYNAFAMNLVSPAENPAPGSHPLTGFQYWQTTGPDWRYLI